MKHRLIITALTCMAAAASPLPAQPNCTLEKAIAYCDSQFPPDWLLSTPARGWCYLAGVACAVMSA
jgi:hypothetical protein